MKCSDSLLAFAIFILLGMGAAIWLKAARPLLAVQNPIG